LEILELLNGTDRTVMDFHWYQNWKKQPNV